MKILAVGMNYVAHCQELHANEILRCLKTASLFLSRISLGR